MSRECAETQIYDKQKRNVYGSRNFCFICLAKIWLGLESSKKRFLIEI